MQGSEEDEGVFGRPTISISGLILVGLALDALTALTVKDAPVDVFSTPPQLDGELITLTLLPRSRWQTLLNLEVIQVCISLLKTTAYAKLCIHSNVTSPRKRPKHPSKPPSSCLLCLASTRGLRRRSRNHKKRQNLRGDWRRPKWGQKVSSAKSSPLKNLQETVSLSAAKILYYL